MSTGEWSDWMRLGALCEDLDVAPQLVQFAILRGRGATTAGGYELERQRDPSRPSWFLYRYRYTGPERRGTRQVSDDDVRAIRRAHRQGTKQSILARRHGVHPATISAIVCGKTHKGVS